ncbi:MAG TPA: stimulus-sensing domain-containing protein [Allosphingosinicella sp.]|nr:stimulus-sensing domain-containing protein [Allosphingosinicella sp.]
MLLHRILAINILALALVGGSIFYLDGFRGRLTASALANAETQARIGADTLAVAGPELQPRLLRRIGRASGTRLRVYRSDGSLALDSWKGAAPTYELRDPRAEPWRKRIARGLDNVFDAIVGAPAPSTLRQDIADSLVAWPEAQRALQSRQVSTMLRRTGEGTTYVSAAAPVGADRVLLLTRNARDIRRIVRDERTTLGIVLLVAIVMSVLLSLFLARTIALPLRRLARAAHRVRLGRAREVAVPLLPARRDEIGLLARALHDMTQTLRDRIDATEAFAADVTHELKNPLASLRSAVDSFDRVSDPDLQRRLLEVIRHDVSRLDRLIVEIAEISRLDAELSRARFDAVDLGVMVDKLLPHWEQMGTERQVQIVFARPRAGSAVVSGDESRLARALDNLVDNAMSFSPPGGLVEIAVSEAGEEVVVSVEDEGPGVASDKRQAIFQRFHSIRPEEEGFGRHSGLGLALARATVEGHGGGIEVEDRHDGRNGARFVIRLPVAAEG